MSTQANRPHAPPAVPAGTAPGIPFMGATVAGRWFRSVPAPATVALVLCYEPTDEDKSKE